MKPSVRRVVAVLTLSLVCLACGGGGGGSSPTEPPPPSSGKQFRFTTGATSAILQGGVIEATVSVDGREVSRMDWSGTSGSCVVLCTIPSDVRGLSAGNHTVTFTVVRQTRTIVDYFVTCNGIVTHENGNQQVVNMPQQRAQLRVGQSVTFNIRI
jgi:hypothetical protein